MMPDPRFLKQPKPFWAHVRSISAAVGYTLRGKQTVKVPALAEILSALGRLGLKTDHIAKGKRVTAFGTRLLTYFEYRADALNRHVEPRLMDAPRAKALFDELCAKHQPQECDIPWNKQSGDKKKPSYFTAIINMMIRANAQDWPCDFKPRSLTTVTKDGKPLRTLARWVDGAFPGPVNLIAVWEIKEYYYTTTFGSRVADGVYETLLDGMVCTNMKALQSSTT